jgi:hypothetical protein
VQEFEAPGNVRFEGHGRTSVPVGLRTVRMTTAIALIGFDQELCPMLRFRYPRQYPNQHPDPDPEPGTGAVEAAVESLPRPQEDMAKPAAALRPDGPPHADYDLYPLGLHELDHYIERAIADRRFHVH